MRIILYIVLLILVASGSFMLGRESARPSTTEAVAGLLGVGQWTGVAAGLLEDARRLYEGAQLKMCQRDTQTLADLNNALSERLRTSESRLSEATQERDRIRQDMRQAHETNKKLAEKLYSDECKDWAEQPVCPGVRELLQRQNR